LIAGFGDVDKTTGTAEFQTATFSPSTAQVSLPMNQATASGEKWTAKY
jgi:hypothetical protein